MNIDFDTYFEKIFKKDKDCPLFHEWAYEQMFHGERLDPKLANKIKLALYRTLSVAFWTGSLTKLTYGKELASRVTVPAGMHKGKKISDLPTSPDVWELLTQMRYTTNDENIRQACIAKLNDLRVHKKMAEDYANKKSKNRKIRF